MWLAPSLAPGTSGFANVSRPSTTTLTSGTRRLRRPSGSAARRDGSAAVSCRARSARASASSRTAAARSSAVDVGAVPMALRQRSIALLSAVGAKERRTGRKRLATSTSSASVPTTTSAWKPARRYSSARVSTLSRAEPAPPRSVPRTPHRTSSTRLDSRPAAGYATIWSRTNPRIASGSRPATTRSAAADT
ncbi:hypothetical protein [Actinoplanes sp. NPDC049118]|uniref:hypothetical protein n=1 Tax=Actinoplanes sp. NPDC049118 TaxID=3155769 RepID=UPI0033EB53FC